jgi:hypothetical protein
MKLTILARVWLLGFLGAFLPGAGFANAIGEGWLTLYELGVRGARTTGRVVRIERENHNTARYVYRVGEAGFEGADRADELVPGQEVVVRYLPTRPEVSRLVDPWWALQGEIFVCFGMGLVTGTGLVLRVAARRAEAAAPGAR